MTDCIVTHAAIIDIIIIVILPTILFYLLQWTDEKCGFGLKLSLTHKPIQRLIVNGTQELVFYQKYFTIFLLLKGIVY